MDELEKIRREVYSPAPFSEHGEEGAASRADKDDENGTDSQVEVGVCATATVAVWLLSN